jgi:hypothetical protein
MDKGALDGHYFKAANDPKPTLALVANPTARTHKPAVYLSEYNASK